jgi:predicted N-acetyltransferase YhbS
MEAVEIVRQNAESFSIVAEIDQQAPTVSAAREALLGRAMGLNWKRKSSQKLRRGRRPSEGLAFVARGTDGVLAGTVRLWDVATGDGRSVLLLGPLAVDPQLKSAGIGKALMSHAISEAKRLGHKAILLVGDEAYYGRFGFTAEKTGGLAMPGPYERHRFLALELVPGSLDGATGTLRPSGRKAKPVSVTEAAGKVICL